MTFHRVSDQWPRQRLDETVRYFRSTLTHLRASLEIGTTYRMFIPQGNDSNVPDSAWWDRTDDFLKKLAAKALIPVFQATRERGEATPVAAAIARYEPIMRKVPHYYFPSMKAWDQKVLKTPHTIKKHILNLQQVAIKNRTFEELPKRQRLKNGAGLIPLLELMAVYPDSARQWITPKEKALVVDRTLVVEDLKQCTFVSAEGRSWYRAGQGCLLVPFVAHDGRLVGHGLVVYDRPLVGEGLEQLVEGWEVLFDATFAPLIANLNSAALSALDGFFLGRVRELRHVLGNKRIPYKASAVPNKDIFVLNKIALYELLESRLQRSSDRFHVVFFDLDGFKSINQGIGHQAADVLLFYIGEQLTDSRSGLFSPKKDRWLCRFGGDEFVGIIPDGGTVDLSSLSARIAQGIRAAQQKYNKERPKKERFEQRLTTSMGWVASRDLRCLEAATGLERARRKLLKSMRDAYALIELADSDTQERVKELGKYGWLEFKARRKLASDKESMCHNLSEWITTVNWLGSRDETRKPKLELRFTPKRGLS